MLPAYVQNLLMNINESHDLTHYRIGGIDANNVASGGSVANMSGNTFTDVIGSINFTVVGS